jgi:hypothetical protein
MKLKHTFLAFLVIFGLLFTTCDLFNGDENNNNNNGDDYKIIVEPLTKTKWGQGNPYNNLFPIAGSDREIYDKDGRPLTNCVITAMAQIMAFYKYPVRGNGQSNLLMPQNITVPTVNLDFPHDWANMPNTYTSSATEQQRNAVATLMYHISAAHGVNDYFVVYTTNFGYDRSIQ